MWEQCSVDDCDTSGLQEHDCCKQNSMDTVGIPTVQRTGRAMENSTHLSALSHFNMGHYN